MADGHLEKSSQGKTSNYSSKASLEANEPPQKKAPGQKSPGCEPFALSPGDKGPMASKITDIFDGIEAAEKSGHDTYKYRDLTIEIGKKGAFKITADSQLRAKFNDSPLPGEPNTFLREVCLPNPLKGTYVKNADGGRSLLGISKGAESHILTQRPIGQTTKSLPLDVTIKFSDFHFKNNVLVGNYTTDVHYGLVPIPHPGKFSKQIWPLVADEEKAIDTKPDQAKPVAPIDGKTIVDR